MCKQFPFNEVGLLGTSTRKPAVRCRRQVFCVLLLLIVFGAVTTNADIVYTKDGKSHSGTITRKDENGLAMILVDGTVKYFRKEEVLRIDDTNKDAQIYTAAASALQFESDGGLGYYYLARWCEDLDWQEAAVGAYNVALSDPESAPLAANELLRLAGQEDPAVLSYGVLAANFSPLFDKSNYQKIEEVRKVLEEREGNLDRDTVSSLYGITKNVASARTGTASKQWEAASETWNKETAAYLEDLLRSFTGYDFARLQNELAFLSRRTEDIYACEACKGQGKVQCPTCKGDGFIVCAACKGAGYTVKRRVQAGTAYTSKVKCNKCGGEGYEVCRTCNKYSQFAQNKRLRLGARVKTMRVSGYVPCRICKGTGRKPNAPKAITFSALTTGDVKSKFLALAGKLYSMMIGEGDTWGSRPLPFQSPTGLVPDASQVSSIFYRGKWFTKDRIDEMKDRNIYQAPEIDEKYLARYMADITSIASKMWPKIAREMSGKNREAVLGAASYLSFMTSGAVFDSFENRVVYSTRFKKDAKGPDRILDGKRFLLFEEDTGGIKRVVAMEIEPEYLPDDLRELLQGADEIDICYVVISGRADTEQEEETVTHNFVLRIAPYYAVVSAGGGTKQYVRTVRFAEGE